MNRVFSVYTDIAGNPLKLQKQLHFVLNQCLKVQRGQNVTVTQPSGFLTKSHYDVHMSVS